MTKRTVDKILADLTAASADLEQRSRDEQVARNARTAALNQVNQLQRELDEAIAEARKAAPSDSDWWRYGKTTNAAG